MAEAEYLEKKALNEQKILREKIAYLEKHISYLNRAISKHDDDHYLDANINEEGKRLRAELASSEKELSALKEQLTANVASLAKPVQKQSDQEYNAMILKAAQQMDMCQLGLVSEEQAALWGMREFCN